MDEVLRFQREYEATSSPEERKRKGQFFTPPEICRFMAGLITVPVKQNFRLFDPSTGIGFLCAALGKGLARPDPHRRLEAHPFENHPEMLPSLPDPRPPSDCVDSGSQERNGCAKGGAEYDCDIGAQKGLKKQLRIEVDHVVRCAR
jgi:hypothetical protein